MLAPGVRDVVDRLLGLPREERIEALMQLSSEHSQAFAQGIKYEWHLWARDSQLVPAKKEWRIFVRLAGRGEGKSRSASEWMRELAEAGKHQRVSIIGPTRELVRKVNVEGESGILAISPPWFKPHWNPSLDREGSTVTMIRLKPPVTA